MGAHETTFKLIRERGGRASFQKWSSFHTAETGAVRINDRRVQ